MTQTRKFSQFFKNTGGEVLFLPWSHVGHVLRPILVLWLVKIWQVSSSGKFMQHLESCLLWQLNVTKNCIAWLAWLSRSFARVHSLLPEPSRRLAPVIKCNAFLFFQSYIVRDISLTEIYRWLVTFGSVRWDISLVQKFEVGSNNCNHVNINSISLHTEWFNATIFTTYQ